MEKPPENEKNKNFSSIPNMLFASFKHLTREEKYLYCNLKCIYWDNKAHAVTLRELSELVDYSTGALKQMLDRLRICGLAQTEIKREKDKSGQEVGNPKYHITILDIWELNKLYFSSTPEARAKLDPSLKLVHEKRQDTDKKPVHQIRQDRGTCSPNDTSLFTKRDKPVPFGEQGQAQNERAKDVSKDPSKNITSTKDSTPPALVPASSSLPSSLIPLENLSDLERAFWDLWCSLKDIKPAFNEKAYGYVKQMAPHITTIDDLNSLLEYAKKKIKDDPSKRDKQVHLGNLKGYYEGWKETRKPVASDKPASKDPLVLWTRTADPAIVEQFKHTRRSEVEKWEALRDSINWEWMTEEEAGQHGWEIGRVFSDREKRELFAAKEAKKLVLWTRDPKHPDFKIDPSAWYFFVEMPLEEARQYDYDLFGGVPGGIQTAIRTNYDREARGEIKRPVLV